MKSKRTGYGRKDLFVIFIVASVLLAGTGIVTADGPTWTNKDVWDVGDIGGYAAPAFADLDNDGDYDVLIGAYDGYSYAYENTGTASSPTWSDKDAWDVGAIDASAKPAFADLDSDGDYDLLIGVQEGYCRGYENTGSVSSPAWTRNSDWDIGYFGVVGWPTPAFADLDNDGDVDVLVGEAGGTSQAYENTAPVAPVPELPTIILMGTGLFILLGYIGYTRKKSRRR